MTARAVFDALPGVWALERRLEPGLGTMHGSATFTRVADDLLDYREDGVLQLAGGFTGPAGRSYRYRLVDGGIDVCFAADRHGGGVLHSLRFTGDRAVAVASDAHLCAADTYTGDYAFRLPGEVVITIEVRGPAKAYTTVTRLSAPDRHRPRPR